MKPKAIRNPAMVRGTDGLLRLEMVDAGRQVVLDPLAELVWDLSDGSSSLEDLAQAASRALDRAVHQEEVFSALDFLADAGLIEERVAPPVAESNVSRRSLLVKIAPVVGAGACMMLGASARAGGLFQDYGESNSKERNSKEPGEKEGGQKTLDRNLEVVNKNAEIASKKVQEYSDKKNEDQNSEKNSKVDHTGRYRVPPNHPLVGKWKYVFYGNGTREYSDRRSCGDRCIEYMLLWTISADGTTSYHVVVSSRNYELPQSNWKYTSTDPATGVWEEFRGELFARADIRIISKDEFELAITFQSQSPKLIGQRRRFVRLW